MKIQQEIGDTTVATALCIYPKHSRRRLEDCGVQSLAFPHYTRKEIILGYILRVGSKLLEMPDDYDQEQRSMFISNNLPHEGRIGNSLLRVILEISDNQDGKSYDNTREFKTMVLQKIRDHYNLIWDSLHYCGDSISCAHKSVEIDKGVSLFKWFEELKIQHGYSAKTIEDRSSLCEKHKCSCSSEDASLIYRSTSIKKDRREAIAAIVGDKAKMRALSCDKCHKIGDYLIVKSAGKRRLVTEDGFQAKLADLIGANSLLVKLQVPEK